MQIRNLVFSKFRETIHIKEMIQGQTDNQEDFYVQNTVLASFIIKHKLLSEKIFLITLATGTKSLPIQLVLQHPKQILRDMHAEILAQRSFKLFLKNWLHKKIQKQSFNFPHDIFIEDKKRNKFTFNSDSYELILYTSEIPCGDCSINQQNKNISGSKPLSKLANDSYSHSQIYKKYILRTKPGRLDLPKNKRSWSLSCSDKIMTWSILGVQGKALFNFFTPIYIDKIIIDSKFHLNQQTVINGLNLKYRVCNLSKKSYSSIQNKLFCYYENPQKKIKRFTYQFKQKNPQIIFLSRKNQNSSFEVKNKDKMIKKWSDISLIYSFPDHLEQINGHTGIKHGGSLKKINIKNLSAFSSTLLYSQLKFQETNYQYAAVKQRIKLLFGQWIDKGKYSAQMQDQKIIDM